jgi:cytochrome c553
MPPVVASGVRPDVRACGVCHRAEGTGGPENSSLAGLPAAYIVQQMADYRSGARSTAVAGRAPQALMIATAKAASDADVRIAAAYFSALEPKKNITVVEDNDVPATFVANWFLAKATPAARETLGLRIVEVPDDLHRFESRDTRMTFTAHVPPGSVAKGRALVAGEGMEKTTACATCHGPGLRGVDAVPSIAGRSPTYIFRQLHEFQSGVRSGAAAAAMKDNVARFDHGDFIAIAAYLATLDP